MLKKQNNYAFIDSQNVHRGIKSLGWELDWKRFRIYLKEKYGVEVAYLFVGFLPEYADRYVDLQKAGFVVKCKPVLLNSSGVIKGNIDADLVVRALADHDEYEKAIIVTSDGDFYSLVAHLDDANKLETVLSPRSATCSLLLKRIAKGKITFMDVLEERLEINEKETTENRDKVRKQK